MIATLILAVRRIERHDGSVACNRSSSGIRRNPSSARRLDSVEVLLYGP